MDWKVTKAGVSAKVSGAASAVLGLAAKYIGRFTGRGGAVSVFLDGRTAAIAVIRPQNRHLRVEMTTNVALEEEALANPSAAGQALAKAIDGIERAPRVLVAAVGAELTFERRIALPPMPVAETDAAVEFQADRVLPFAASEMRADYVVESTDANGVQSIVISAITSEAYGKIEELSKAAGLTLSAIYAAPSALYAVTAADAETSPGVLKAVVYPRAEGFEMAVGTTKSVAMSRFAKDCAPRNVAGELSRTASAAGIEVRDGALVFAPGDLGGTISLPGQALDVRALEDALEAASGTSGEGHGAAAAIAAGTVYMRGGAVPNYHVPSALARRTQRASAFQRRIVKYCAAGGAVVALFSLSLIGYWVYTFALESKARGLAAANAGLKTAIARADTARPWITGRKGLLEVLSGVTDVFPSSPSAFVKSLSVAESGKVAVQGRVPNAQAAYDLVAALSKVKGFRNVKLDSGSVESSGGYNFAISFEADNWEAKR